MASRGDVIIRERRSEDDDAIKALFVQGMKSVVPECSPLHKEYVKYAEENLKQDMADIEQYYMLPARRNFWVAELDGAVVGIVATEPHLVSRTFTPFGSEDEIEDARAVHCAELRRMAVDLSARGRGVSSQLACALVEWCGRNGFTHVRLTTSSEQVPAMKVYEGHRWKKLGAFSIKGERYTEEQVKQAPIHIIEYELTISEFVRDRRRASQL